MALQQFEQIKTAVKEHEGDLLATLTLAFSADPGTRWIWPRPADYLQHYPPSASHYVETAIEHGTAYYVGDFAGVAIWLPPGIYPDEDALGATMAETVPAEKLAAGAAAVLEKLEEYRPDDPFWELSLLGVEPTQRGQGYGDELIEPVLTECDREGILVFLYSTNDRNLSLYRRHGFDLVGTIEESAFPRTYAMVRQPQARRIA